MSEIELKLCPFCGAEATMLNAGDDCYKVFCRECGAEVPWAETEEEAAKTWNTRVSISDKWINVKDRLPERTGNYLVCGKMYLPQTAFFDISGGGWYDNWITHWMPLPRQPEGMEDFV